jgi:hypothetical protein
VSSEHKCISAATLRHRARRLRNALEAAWSRETTVNPANWSERNPAWGQCAVTALIVQDELGGELLRATVQGVSHYWNLLETGEELDFTRRQFSDFPDDLKGLARVREQLLANDDTARRYRKLRDAVAQLEGIP